MTVIESIREDLNKYEMILMIVDGQGMTKNLTADFCGSQALKERHGNILLLSTADIGCAKQDHYTYRRLSEEELRTVGKLYAMYDFSDRFRVLSDNMQYGGLINYVKAGYMSMEEVFQCFMDRKQN